MRPYAGWNSSHDAGSSGSSPSGHAHSNTPPGPSCAPASTAHVPASTDPSHHFALSSPAVDTFQSLPRPVASPASARPPGRARRLGRVERPALVDDDEVGRFAVQQLRLRCERADQPTRATPPHVLGPLRPAHLRLPPRVPTDSKIGTCSFSNQSTASFAACIVNHTRARRTVGQHAVIHDEPEQRRLARLARHPDVDDLIGEPALGVDLDRDVGDVLLPAHQRVTGIPRPSRRPRARTSGGQGSCGSPTRGRASSDRSCSNGSTSTHLASGEPDSSADFDVSMRRVVTWYGVGGAFGDVDRPASRGASPAHRPTRPRARTARRRAPVRPDPSAAHHPRTSSSSLSRFDLVHRPPFASRRAMSPSGSHTSSTTACPSATAAFACSASTSAIRSSRRRPSAARTRSAPSNVRSTSTTSSVRRGPSQQLHARQIAPGTARRRPIRTGSERRGPNDPDSAPSEGETDDVNPDEHRRRKSTPPGDRPRRCSTSDPGGWHAIFPGHPVGRWISQPVQGARAADLALESNTITVENVFATVRSWKTLPQEAPRYDRVASPTTAT